jgi:phage gpG-like protein
MIGMALKIIDETEQVKQAVDKSTYKNLGHAAASIRKDANATIERSPEPSRPGRPPHTRRGQAKRALRYAVENDMAVIGFSASVVGEAMAAHEFGGQYKGEDFPERPTMGPTLEKDADKLPGFWSGEVHN